MKAKKLMGMIACAGACVSLSALANTNTNWFDVAVSNGDIVLTDVTTNGVAVTIEESKIKIDGDNPLSFTPAAGKDVLSDGLVTICAKAELTPSSASEFDSPSGAKTGFAVGIDGSGDTNYYGFANGTWTKLTGSVNPPATGDTEFKLVVDYRVPNVKFFVKSNDEYVQIGEMGGYTIATASNLTRIEASGSGSLSSVDADYEIAVAQYGETKYGSIAEASSAATAAGKDPTAVVQVVNSDGTPGDAGAIAANGLSEIVCKALGLPMDNQNANIAVAPAAADNDPDEITLAVNVDAAPEASAVKFVVSNGTTSSEYDNASAIKIPLTAGTYTITPALK